MTSCQLAFETCSPEETEALGARLLSLIPHGGMVALFGDLAAGKTCLVRGMAGHNSVSSPTFTIVNEYPGPPKLYHIDLYRLAGIDELADLGYEELFEPDDGVTLVEWAERARGCLPDKRLEIHLEHAGEDRRRITLINYGLLPEKWQETLTA